MTGFVTRAAACLTSLLLAVPVPAQAPAPAVPASAPAQMPQPAPPLLRVTTRMVQVNVVVHGKKNESVAGLTKDDFEIYDAGVKQQIATLALEALQPSAVAPKTVSKVPNVFSNLAPYRTSSPKAITVILMDGLNTAFADQAYARQQLIKFLHTLTPQDRVALYALGRDLRVLHDFTDDPAVLLKALDRHKAHIGPELADSLPEESNTGDDGLDAFLDQANQAIADYQTINRVRTTLNAIEAISQHLSALPGRKNLVWISGGFPFSIGMEEMNIDSTAERRTFSDELEHATRAVTAAALAIYPVDARGLIGQPDLTASSAGGKNIRKPPSGPSKAMQNIQKTHDTMEILAERTGGKAYYNSNDIKSAIRGAIDDSRLTYVLGYYPTHNTWDGKFHELKVKVNRSGVNARYRLGYFAFPEQPTTEQARKAALNEAAWSPLDASGVGMSLRLGPDIPEKGKLRLLLVVEPRHITLAPKDGRWVGMVDVLFMTQAAPDKPPVFSNQALNLNLTKETYDLTMKRGLVLARDFSYPDSAYRMKVVVRDGPTGNVGSVNIRTDHLAPVPPAAPAAATPKP